MPLTEPSTTHRDDAPLVFACPTRSEADVAWVHVAGELDLAGAPLLAVARRDALCEARLVVLGELTFRDPAGVHAIADARVQARIDGRRLRLRRRAPDRVQRVFALTGPRDDIDVFAPGRGEPTIQALRARALSQPERPTRGTCA